MEKLKVINVSSDIIEFEGGIILSSEHEQDCCENHYLWMKDLSIEDFNDLEFDLSKDNFFKRIPEYGIALIPIKGRSVNIPGYGWNNGYYSSNLDLILTDNKGFIKKFDISDCQVISE